MCGQCGAISARLYLTICCGWRIMQEISSGFVL